MTHSVRPENRNGFEIAVICALPTERNAIEAHLDEDYESDGRSYGKAAGDPIAYTLGRIGTQHVVLAYMPGMGTISATVVATCLRASFENIKLCVVVGVCGGSPKTADGTEILLGDVIVSTSVVQIDFGRLYAPGFIRKKDTEDTLGRASPEIRSFIGKLSGYLVSRRLKEKTNAYTAEICGRCEFLESIYPGPRKDRLFEDKFIHKHRKQGCCTICDHHRGPTDEMCEESFEKSCEDLGCDEAHLIQRDRLKKAMGINLDENGPLTTEMQEARKPCIHFGRIACGNQVIKSAQHRDAIAKAEGVIGFETKSAGTWDYVPTIVVKGVCDYADSHKNKDWQKYAAMTAAACTKAILEEWRTVHPNNSGSDAYPVHWTITRSTNALFRGRDDILHDLKTIVTDSSCQDQCRIVISGIGGQGKSEICLQLAYRIRKSFWGVFWVDTSTPSLAESGFLNIASKLGIQAQSWQDGRQGLANLKKPWLLVLDNADGDFDYQQYFPPTPSGVVIMTSRNADTQGYATRWIELEGLPDTDARELLLQSARVSADKRQALMDDAAAVARLLQSHPLALIQAGSYLSRGHCSMKDYPKIFQQQRKRLLTFRPKQAQSRYGDVYATFEASAEILESLNTECANDALHLMPVLGSCGPNNLPLALFEAAWKEAKTIDRIDETEIDGIDGIETDGIDEIDDRCTLWHVHHLPPLVQKHTSAWDSFRLIEAINLLKSFSLLSINGEGEFLSVSMHPLIHAWTKDRLSAEEQHKYWVEAGCLFAMPSRDDLLWHTHRRQLQLHLQELMSLEMSDKFRSESPNTICCILIRCGSIMRFMRDDKTLSHLLHHLCTYLKLNESIVDRRYLPIYELYARNLLDLWETSRAVSLFEQIVHIRKHTLPEDHATRLTAQRGLASAYLSNSQFKKAISLLKHVVEIEENTLPEDHPNQLGSQHELAMAYMADGQIEKAVSLLKHVVKIRKNTLPEDHPSQLVSQHELARAYMADGQIEKAISLNKHVVEIEENTLAEDHPDRLASQHELARAYMANGKIEKAVSLFKHVVEIRKRTLADDDPRLLSSLDGLAMTYFINGQVKEAISLLAHVVEIRKRTLAEDHSDQLSLQHGLAVVYYSNGQFQKAISLLEHVVEIRKRTLADDHPDRLLASQDVLALLYEDLKRHGQEFQK